MMTPSGAGPDTVFVFWATINVISPFPAISCTRKRQPTGSNASKGFMKKTKIILYKPDGKLKEYPDIAVLEADSHIRIIVW
jgi:hypothetical protein